MTLPHQQENEMVLIGGQEVSKHQIFITTLGITIAVMCSSLAKMIDETKGNHYLWNTAVKNTLLKCESAIMNKISHYSHDPEMVEKMADAEFLASVKIAEVRDEMHRTLFDFCIKPEDDRNILINEEAERAELVKEIEYLSKLANVKALRQSVISLRKGKNK